MTAPLAKPKAPAPATEVGPESPAWRPGVGWSVAAALLAAVIAAASQWLLGLYPPSLTAGIFLVPLAIFTAGWAVGLVDRRRPRLTSGIVFATLTLALTSHTFADVTIPHHLLAAAGAGLLASFGAQAVRLSLRRRWLAPGGSVLLLLAYAATLFLPYFQLERAVDEFLTTRETEIEAYLQTRLVTLPMGRTPWRHEAQTRTVHRVEYATTWIAAPAATGLGRARVLIRAKHPGRGRELSRSFVSTEFNFLPRRPAELATAQEVRQLLRELDVLCPESELARSAAGEWEASAVRDGWEHRLRIEHGWVTASHGLELLD